MQPESGMSGGDGMRSSPKSFSHDPNRSVRRDASDVARQAMLVVGRAMMSGGDASEFIHREAGHDPEVLAECLSLLQAAGAPHSVLDHPPSLEPASPDLKPALERLRLRPPGEVGGYMIRDILGYGATALVYRARSKKNDSEVALKVIPCVTESAHALARFETETESLARLWHPGIVRIFAAGVDDMQDGHLLWIAMELVNGVPLTEFARVHNMSIHDRVHLFMKACDA
ncbi:MAG: protein kinase, partial [Pyrinomonadaceae bacterium]|nr:protein kinase [Phycisphaerales bacterium]